jgi:hypothetical protein
MKKFIASTTILLVLFLGAAAQKKPATVNNYADITLGFGSSQVTGALAYNYNWRFGKKRRIEIGLGARFTSYFGTNLYFITAPATLTSGKTGLGVIFSDNIPQNIDSVLFAKAQVNALNIAINLGYNITPKLSVGFNIDAIGISFGSKKEGTYYGNNFATGVATKAKTTSFNALLTSDNDKGSLNSELFARYKWNGHWGVKLAYQFLFVEYKTDTKVQTAPTGETNDRFRKKMSGIGVGVSYHF